MTTNAILAAVWLAISITFGVGLIVAGARNQAPREKD